MRRDSSFNLKYVVLWVIFLLPTTLFSITNSNLFQQKVISKAESIYYMTTTLNDTQREFLKLQNFTSSTGIIDFFIRLSSKDVSFDELRHFYSEKLIQIDNRLISLYGTVETLGMSVQKKKLFCDSVNQLMHEMFFSKYSEFIDSFEAIATRGEYNCVSSSILYASLLSHYNIECIAVETSVHVFISIQFSDEIIDVETTNPNGFDPGSKKDVLDELGRITGFEYVPQKKYRDRNNINTRILLLLLSHNSGVRMSKANRYQESVQLAYFGMIGRNDKRGRDNFQVAVYNLLLSFSRKKEYALGLEVARLYRENFEFTDKRVISLHLGLYQEYFSTIDNFDAIQNFRKRVLLEAKWFNLTESLQYLKLVEFIDSKLVEYCYSNADFQNSYEMLMSIGNLKLSKLLLQNIYVSINKRALEDNNYQNAIQMLDKSKRYSFFDKKLYESQYFQLVNNYVVFLIHQKNYKGAIALLHGENCSGANYKKLLQSVYVAYSYDLYKRDHIVEAIQLSVEAINRVGIDRVLKNNLKSYWFVLQRESPSDFSHLEEELGCVIQKYFLGDSDFL